MQLTLDHLTKEFTTDAGEHIVALSDITLEIRDSEFICLLGPSGCGKTTLLRIIGGLDQPSSGQVILDNQVISRPNPRMAMIFQEYSLYPWRNVLDNTAFGLEINGMSREERYAVAKRYLDLVGLTEFSQSFPYELSGGMRQRVAVVRALAVEPAVLLMDEPFGALDAQTRNKLQHDLVDIWQKTKKMILFVTHSVDEAVFLADRIIVLSPRPGRICENIPIEQPRPRDRTSVEFAQVRRHVLDLISLK